MCSILYIVSSGISDNNNVGVNGPLAMICILNILQKMKTDVHRMAVPKMTKTRCRNGSVQARHAIQRLHK